MGKRETVCERGRRGEADKTRHVQYNTYIQREREREREREKERKKEREREREMEIEIDKIFFPCFLLISSLPLFGGCGEGLEQVGRFTFLMSGTEELSGAFSSRGAG